MKRPFLNVLFVILFASCEYEPVEKNFKEVDSELINTIGVDLNDLSDTIELTAPLTIRYNLQFPKDVRFIVSVKIGDQIVHESSSLPDSFNITPFQFDQTFLPFRMEIVTSSGTNSLADKLGAEALLFQVEKVVWVEKSPPVKININSIILENGNLKISWDRYPKINFKSYVIRKVVFSEQFRAPTLSELFTITDRNQTSFIDPNYIGGDAQYYIESYITSYTAAEFGDVYAYNHERSEVVAFETIGSSLKVSWKRPAFFNAFEQYRLSPSDDLHDSFFASKDIQDTTFVIDDLGFGRSMELQLNTTPHNAHGGGGPVDDFYATYKEVYLGEKMQPYDILFETKNNGRVYFYKNNYLYVANDGEAKPYDSLEVKLNFIDWAPSFGMSADGQLLYIGTGTSIQQLDPQTLDFVKEISVPFDSVVPDAMKVGSIAVGNQDMLAIDIKYRDYNSQIGYTSDIIAIMDGNTGMLKDSVKAPINLMTLQASEDLKYLYDQHRIIELNSNGNEVRIENLSSDVSGKGYFADNKLYLYKWSKRFVFDLNTFSLTNQYAIQDWLQEISIEPTIGYVSGVTSDGFFRVYNYKTWEEIKRVKLYEYAVSDISGNNSFILKNGVLYSALGYKIKLF